MSVLMIVNAKINPKKTEALKEYSSRASEIFKKAGAQPVQKISIDQTLTGTSTIDFISITEWPDKETLTQVFSSKSYEELLTLRQAAFESLDVFVSAG